MNILLIEPFFTGSHASWAKGLQTNSSNKIEILKMSGHYWKWRMHGGAVTLAAKFMNMDFIPDLILASDMLDLTTFLALTKAKTAQTKTAIYFHENQLVYPWSPTDPDVQNQRDNHYSFINYTSALCADHVFFNSNFHRQSFLNALSPFLKHFPDHNELHSVESIWSKSTVLKLGLSLNKFDEFKHDPKNEVPVILWNHRWEYDKNPKDFFAALYAIQEKGVDFQVIILGEKFKQSPDDFERARNQLGEKIIHFGFSDNLQEYAHLLWKADVIPVTSKQDFFGISVVEAICCNCFPLLPNRLAFPEHIPDEFKNNHLYNSQEDLTTRLLAYLHNFNNQNLTDYRAWVSKYDWSKMIGEYDAAFERLTEN